MLIRKDGGAIDLCPGCVGDSKNINWDDAIWRSDHTWDDSLIPWKSDKYSTFVLTEQIYGKTTNQGRLQTSQNITLPNTFNNDFIVWMRTSSTPIITKLHRIINIKNGIYSGDIINITIVNYFDVTSFNGNKSLIFTTNNVLGGKNVALGTAYLIVGILSIIMYIIFSLYIPNDIHITNLLMKDIPTNNEGE